MDTVGHLYMWMRDLSSLDVFNSLALVQQPALLRAN